MTPESPTVPTARAHWASYRQRGHSPAEIVQLDSDVIAMLGFTTTVGTCIDCCTVLGTISDAQGHARDARHRVECDRRTAFTFAPTELFDGVR